MSTGWLPAPAEELFGPDAVAEEAYELLTVDVPPAAWTEALETARTRLGCTYFDWLSAVDEPGTGFRVAAHVVALAPVRRLLLRTTVPHDAPVLASAVTVYAGAAWHERETHEMFGVTFEDHPGLDPRRAVDEERPEHGGLGRVAVRIVVDRDRLHGRAEHVGEQDELLAPLVGDVSRVGEEADPGLPLGLGQPDLAQEGVQVPGQRLHQLLQARVGGGVEGAQHALDQVLLAGLLLGWDGRAHAGSAPSQTARRSAVRFLLACAPFAM